MIRRLSPAELNARVKQLRQEASIEFFVASLPSPPPCGPMPDWWPAMWRTAMLDAFAARRVPS
ncbi:hypothetical protein GCM10017643_27000 [Ancylobacter dichloromethanicus]|uniref:Uncharacterized protein n=1 Tax=Ancylobacter dichloromethanicus TaxID=518825 RepID=A0A9W6JAS9_9HYPH|nr:hypothetical protein GCM10017643_27000 [Ancylobacter dichloromethanicus]